MKFPRNARIFRGQLDVAPFAAVFFLLVIFVLLTTLVYTPGVHITLPSAPAADIAGVDGPTVAVAVDKNGRYYYQNRIVNEADLKRALEAEVKKFPQPPTLILLSDQETANGMTVRLMELARSQGIKKVVFQTLPRPATPTPPRS
jgi:biopolymer transport protein ExbD